MPNTALLINSYQQKNGQQGQWNAFVDAPSYIRGINTGQLANNLTSEQMAALISGLPSPWARAKLFKFAFDSIANPDPNVGQGSLGQYYNTLLGEWKGLVAVLALYGDRIRFSDPVYMPTDNTGNCIASDFGKMLFTDRDLWCDQQALATNQDAQPFIQLIYYNNILIGGTSPMTAFFTGINYSNLQVNNQGIPWYRNGVFEDPTNYLMGPDLQKVYLFVSNMNRNSQQFDTMVNSQRNGKPNLDITGFTSVSMNWEQTLLNRGQGMLTNRGPIAQYENLNCPFSILLNNSEPVYIRPDGQFTYTNGVGYILINDIQKLLSSEHYVVGWAETQNSSPSLNDSKIHYLMVNDIRNGNRYFFTLPLSEMGLSIFQNRLEGLLGGGAGTNARLNAAVTNQGKLSVSMDLEIDGVWTQLITKEYTISWQTIPGKVILWPNFVSDNWDKYYLYSEFTSDARQRFFPIFQNAGQLMMDGNGHIITSEYVPIAGQQNPVNKRKLVSYPQGVDMAMPKYDITRFNKPVIGLAVKAVDGGIEYDAGYLMLRSDRVRNYTNVQMMQNAVVGFDFGSNNTCVYYNPAFQGPQPVEFENYRIVMVGHENPNMRSIATNDELLFFSNYPSINGQVKSWLHEHDSRYNPYSQSEEVSGGVPVHRPNVLVREMTKFDITTQAGKMHYNMKWLDDDGGLNKKLSFLKTVWIHTCAYLYTHQITPTHIEWSYPGSMMPSDINNLAISFQQLPNITPIVGVFPNVAVSPNIITESEAVCSFALGGDFALGNNNIILGIDVGGSTSDILLLAKNGNNQDTLMRESSVRMAAGVFFNAIIRSDVFRNALISFHQSGAVDGLYVENIHEIISHVEKAPYYLNNIFDQLKNNQDFDVLYTSLNANARKVFTIPAYVTGMLLFYSGMMIGKAIQDNQLNNIQQVDVFSFGKGGRLFHWLSCAAAQNIVDRYYAECVNAGLACVARGINLGVTYHKANDNSNKSEVAQGLCRMQNLYKAPQATDCDICGECNVHYTDVRGTRLLDPGEELTGDYFVNNMNNFNFGNASNLGKFMDLFFDFVDTKTGICKGVRNQLANTIDNLPNHFKTYITNHDPEYQKALRNNNAGFHYHQPIIIAEALYLQNHLIDQLF